MKKFITPFEHKESVKLLSKKSEEVKELYNEYVKKWKKEHKGQEFKGMEPVCFSEWYDNEYLDFIED